MAKLYFSFAAMNAGKSTILLQAAFNYREQGMTALIFTSAHHASTDDRRIVSRIGISAEANIFHPEDDLFAAIETIHKGRKQDCVLVDEAQFLTKAQVWQLARVADRLNIPVLCYGLRTDFRGELFEGSAQLLAIADSLREIRTICHCGAKASMVIRQDEDGNAIREGEVVTVDRTRYASLCRRHWEEAMGRWPPAQA